MASTKVPSACVLSKRQPPPLLVPLFRAKVTAGWEEKFLSLAEGRIYSAAYFSVERGVITPRHAGGGAGRFNLVADLRSPGKTRAPAPSPDQAPPLCHRRHPCRPPLLAASSVFPSPLVLFPPFPLLFSFNLALARPFSDPRNGPLCPTNPPPGASFLGPGVSVVFEPCAQTATGFCIAVHTFSAHFTLKIAPRRFQVE